MWPAADIQRLADRARGSAASAAPATRAAQLAATLWPAADLPRVVDRPEAGASAPAPARNGDAVHAPTTRAAELADAGPEEADAPAGDGPVVTQEVASRVSAIGYVLVSRPGPHAKLGAARGDADETIRALCDAHRVTLASIARDVEGPRGDAGARPGLRWALDQLVADRAQTLVVARLAHLTDSAAALSELLRWFEEHERTLIAVDFGLDTSTEGGRLAASALVHVGGWEHERISARTRRGLEAVRSSAAASGRPAVADVPVLRDRIRRMRAEGMTLQAIADVLNAEGVPTLRGGAKWRPSSVQSATGYRRPSSKRLDLPPGARRE